MLFISWQCWEWNPGPCAGKASVLPLALPLPFLILLFLPQMCLQGEVCRCSNCTVWPHSTVEELLASVAMWTTMEIDFSCFLSGFYIIWFRWNKHAVFTDPTKQESLPSFFFHVALKASQDCSCRQPSQHQCGPISFSFPTFWGWRSPFLYILFLFLCCISLFDLYTV